MEETMKEGRLSRDGECDGRNRIELPGNGPIYGDVWSVSVSHVETQIDAL